MILLRRAGVSARLAAGTVAAAIALWLSACAALAADKALDNALLPLYSTIPADVDLAHVKAAFAATAKQDYASANAEAGAIKDKLALDLVRWDYYRNGGEGASPDDIMSFVGAHGDWPVEELIASAEESLFKSRLGGEAIKRFFGSRQPVTAAGKVALAEALLASGDTDAARKLASSTWRNDKMPDGIEDEVAERLGSLLSPKDHKWRLDRILLDDSRWENVRQVRIAAARRVAKRLDKGEQQKAEARIAVYDCYRGGKCLGRAKSLYAKLPAGALDDWGAYFHKVQLLRRDGKEKDAWLRLLKAPADPALLVDPDGWWVERRTNAYNALYAGEPKVAYRLAAEHGPLTVNPLKDAEFMAGWIALRFLKDASTAERHFLALRKAADGPISATEADYWLGRTYQALGNDGKAQEHYASAGRDLTTFYGQLAHQTQDKGATALELASPPVPPEDEQARFAGNSAVRAVMIASKAGLSEVMRTFASHLRYRFSSEGELVMLAHLAASLGDTQMALRIGKTGMGKGFRLAEYAYPTHAMPKFSPLRPLPEEAIFYAIARQESEFNTLIVSGAGARGILQVMPVTAKHICGQYKIKCELGKLSSDPSYNARLATAYIADRNDDFTGSYIMAFAGYNAGPGRVRQWIGKIGDPRAAGIDPVDWIELIHIEETRDYVQKVLANVQVYRARLGDAGKALRTRQDLVRSRSKTETAAN